MLVLWTMLACSAAPVRFDAPIPVDGTFAKGTPTAEELARYEAAAAYSEAHKGRAFVVIKGDEVMFATGQNGHGLNEPHHLFSGTKTFACALWAVAEREGWLNDDTKLASQFPEAPAQLTVDQVLHLTSGTKQDFWRLTRDSTAGLNRVPDKVAHARSLGYQTDPGETFAYGSAHFFLFSGFVEQASGRNPLELLRTEVFDPIGMKTSGWITDSRGHPALSYGAFTTAYEWAKFGVLLRDDGAFLGKQVLPAGSVKRCFEGSTANPAYGRGVWLNRAVDDSVKLVAVSRLEEDGPILYNEGPADLVAAAGHDDQRLYIVPSADLVVARLADGGWGFKDAELLARVLGYTTTP